MGSNQSQNSSAVESPPEVRPGAPPGDAAAPTAADRRRQVNVFAAGDRYLLRHYFESERIFETLEPYYHPARHRFEVPADAFGDVVGVLSGHGYDVTVVDDPARFAVAVRKYTDHPEVVFERAVLEVSTGAHNVFVLADDDAVERAVADGATRLRNTPLQLRLPTSPGAGPVTVEDVTLG